MDASPLGHKAHIVLPGFQPPGPRLPAPFRFHTHPDHARVGKYEIDDLLRATL